MFYGTNATGWTELMDANLIGAAFSMYDSAFMGLTVAILFVIYQIMLLYKTQNLTLAWVTGLFFASIYVSAETFLKPISIQIIFVLLVFELAGVLYYLFWK